MAHLVLRRKSRRFWASDILWLTSLASTTLLFVVIVVFYGTEIDGVGEGKINVDAGGKNGNDKSGLVSREETLLQLATELESELARSRRRIQRRLVLLERRNGDERGALGTRHGGKTEGAVRGGVLAPPRPQSLKRRLMDARSSLGREVGPGLDYGDWSDSNTSLVDIAYRTHEANGDVKASRADDTVEIWGNSPPNKPPVPSKGNAMNVYRDGDLVSSDESPENSSSARSNTRVKVTTFTKTVVSSKARWTKRLNRTDLKEKRSFDENLKSHPSTDSNYSNRSHNDKTLKFNYEADKKGWSTSTGTNKATLDRHEPREATGGDMFTPLEAATVPLLGCGDLARVNSRELVGTGYTKRVERARLDDGRSVALKSVLIEGKDVQTCLGLGMTESDCVQLANYKLLKETALLMQLQHPNILKLLGFCMNDKPSEAAGSLARLSATVTMMVEMGDPLTFLGYLQMPWEERFRICLGVSRLLAYMANSPLGSLAIHDFKMVQFVLVDGEVKLADLDDVDDGHRPCSSTSDCGLQMGVNDTVYAECRDGACVDYSEMSNLVSAHSTFFSLLHFDAPKGVADFTGRLVNNTKLARWSAVQVSEHMEEMLDYYKEGRYLKYSPQYSKVNETQFQIIPDSDLAGSDDYWCPGSRQMTSGCALSVHDAREAMVMCACDSQCRAFVMTSHRTWTGRIVAYFKKGLSISPQSKQGHTTYLLSI